MSEPDDDKDKTVIRSVEQIFGARGNPPPPTAPQAPPVATGPYANPPGMTAQPAGLVGFGQGAGGTAGWGNAPSPAPGFAGLAAPSPTGGGMGAAPNPAFGAFPAPSGAAFGSHAAGIGQPTGPGEPGLFANIGSPRAAAEQAAPARKIDLNTALSVRGFPPGALKNPIIAQAANLLVLFGRLRMQVVAMDAVPLVSHIAREIDQFQANLGRTGIDGREVMIGKYLLCATADDIIQNLPGTDRQVWQQYSMAAKFFNDRNSSSGFFHEIDKLLAVPGQSFRLLELALLCLSLGFEGRFRAEAQGGATLQQYRTAIYESLRRVESRPGEDISPHWQPVVKETNRKFGGAALLALGGFLAALLAAGYIGLRTLLGTDAEAASVALRDIIPKDTITLSRPPDVIVAAVADPAKQPVTGQMERIGKALDAEIRDSLLEMGRKGQFIFVRLTSDRLFASGKAEVSADFDAVAGRLGAMMGAEKGEIRIIGYTDNIGVKATSKFKNNIDLSQKRAESVQGILTETMADPERLTAEGRGEEDPIADNTSPEGRARNRRVEIWIPRAEGVE